MVTIRCNEILFQNIQAIAFDKDGTLADSATFLRTLAQRRSRLVDAQIPGVQEPLLLAFGVDRQWLNPAGLMAVGTRRENEIAAAAYVAETGRDWLGALKLVEKAFVQADASMTRKADHTPLVEGALSLLQRLSSAGVRLGILSSDTTANVQDFVQRYELEPYFQLQMGTDGTLAKPDPKVLEQACACLGVSPQQTLVVGDSPVDIELAQAAIAAGCIAVHRELDNTSHLSKADVVIQHFDQIQLG
ncbi:HAD family hydrolase [Oscillatoria sp. FACHB-1407]|nr:HAD family hydrolase [Oscillatoria sp. FACHB-1407]